VCSAIQLKGPASVAGRPGPQTVSSCHREEEKKSQLPQNARIGEDSGRFEGKG